MFVFTFEDFITKYQEDVYAISEQGKRWFLKQILTACGVEAGQDGVYDWDIPDVLDQEIMGLVEHEPNEYFNRDGEKVSTTQHRIVEVRDEAGEEWPEENN